MPAPRDRVPVPGSERAPVPGAHAIGAVDPAQRIEVTVVLRPRPADQAAAATAMEPRLPAERTYLTREQFATQQGADPDDLHKVEAFAAEHDLTVVQENPAARTIVLSGTVANINTAFSIELQHYESHAGRYRGRTGPIYIPNDLEGVVIAVLGADDRPVATPHLRRLDGSEGAVQAHAAGASFTPPQLAKLYDFPTGATGAGQCIGIIELGGGLRRADIVAYFQGLNLPVPRVVSVSVNGGHSHPTTANSADGEVMLDIEVAGGVAPGERLAVYFAPNTTQGFLNAITTAMQDTRNRPSVISISWGAPESGWTAQAMQAMNLAFRDATTLGISVFCASGDNGSSDGVSDGKAHVDFPASSPFVTGCGGTHLEAANNAIAQESVWNNGASGGTGGGVSAVFPLPQYQTGAGVPAAPAGSGGGRGVPDVAGDADPRSGYVVRVDGQQLVFGGTSAVAPLWAGLTALLNEALGRPVGFLNPLLYGPLANPTTKALHDVTAGSNDTNGTLGVFKAGPGWDACTGLGSPDGARILQALGGR